MMNKILKGFKLTTLGACLTLALTTGVITTAASAASNVDEVRAAQAAKISLKQAITIASKSASGILISADFDEDDSDAIGKGGVYELEFSTDSVNYEIKVDANTGKIVKKETDRLDGDDINVYQVQKKAKIDIMKAINIAEKQSGEACRPPRFCVIPYKLGNANCEASWLARCGQRWVIALRRV